MAKLPDKFEDWTRPWQDGEFDEEKAARRIFNSEKALEKAKERNAALNTENQELKDKVDDFEHDPAKAGAGKSADEKDERIRDLEKQIRKLQNDGRPEDKSLIERLEVAIEHGLTANDARRLVGTNRDELDADAKDLAERLGVSTGDDGDSGEDGSAGTDGLRQRPAPTVRPGSNGGGTPPPKVLSVRDLLKQDGALSGRSVIPQR